jgi:hypothetical protein
MYFKTRWQVNELKRVVQQQSDVKINAEMYIRDPFFVLPRILISRLMSLISKITFSSTMNLQIGRRRRRGSNFIVLKQCRNICDSLIAVFAKPGAEEVEIQKYKQVSFAVRASTPPGLPDGIFSNQKYQFG